MRCERGVALLTVMFILALLVTASAYTVADQYLAIRRAANVRDMEQAIQMATGSERWAVKVLARDRQSGTTDHLGEAWHNLGPGVTVEEGQLATAVEDLQGRFNLNNLAAGRDQVWYPAFVRLLQVLELEPQLADAVVDWIDSDQIVTGAGGAEDADYLGREPAYRSANRLFSDVSELIWVAGFDSEAVSTIAPYVSALPAADVRINANTCSEPVLRILGAPPLAEGAATELAAGRGENGYETVADVLRHSVLAGKAGTAENLISVSSEYFLINSRAEFGRVTVSMASTAYRSADSGQARVLRRRRIL